MIPPYFKQERSTTCTLAVLRMVLAYFGNTISEDELRSKVIKDYGSHFKNIWNPTIAKLACKYGLDTTMYADWPLFKKATIEKARATFENNGDRIKLETFENSTDNEEDTEPLSLAYSEMFKALNCGTKAIFGKFNEKIIRNELGKGKLILLTVILPKLYPDKGVSGHHGILIYEVKENNVIYHDPTHGASLTITFNALSKAQDHVAAGIAFKKL